IKAALTGVPVRIFGADYNTTDGTCVRDYVHVSDIADAHVQALVYLLQGGKIHGLNLANARGYSVKEVFTVAERVCGHSILMEIVPRRPGDPPILIGDSGRAHAILGWHPRRSELTMQITDAWNWIRRQQKQEKDILAASE